MFVIAASQWWLAGASSPAAYLCAVVVHRQHAEHVQCVSALDEFAHGVGHGALASVHRGRCLVARRTGQLVHADDAVLAEWAGRRAEILIKEQKRIFSKQKQVKQMFTSSSGAATTSM